MTRRIRSSSPNHEHITENFSHIQALSNKCFEIMFGFFKFNSIFIYFLLCLFHYQSQTSFNSASYFTFLSIHYHLQMKKINLEASSYKLEYYLAKILSSFECSPQGKYYVVLLMY